MIWISMKLSVFIYLFLLIKRYDIVLFIYLQLYYLLIKFSHHFWKFQFYWLNISLVDSFWAGSIRDISPCSRPLVHGKEECYNLFTHPFTGNLHKLFASESMIGYLFYFIYKKIVQSSCTLGCCTWSWPGSWSLGWYSEISRIHFWRWA